jgi:phosphoribosyl-ATP pyrophosphohydrolase
MVISKAKTKAPTNKQPRQDADKALAKFMEENKEIAEALDVMKQAQLIRTLRPFSLDRFSYHSVE